MVPFHLPLLEVPGDISLIFSQGPGQIGGGKTPQKCGSPSVTGFPCSFSLLVLSTLSLQQFINYSSGFPALGLVPMEMSAAISCDSSYLSVCLFSYEEQSFAPWPYFSDGSVNSCSFSSLVTFSLVRMVAVCNLFTC